MERLIRVIKARGESVVVYTKGKYEDTTAGEMRNEDIRNVMKHLHDYEDTGLTPPEIRSIATELKEYKQLELSPKRLSEHVAFCRRYHELFGAVDFSRLKELKERDTAKAAIITGYNHAIGCKVGECPKCGAMTRDYLMFCSDCGQRLKWEE